MMALQIPIQRSSEELLASQMMTNGGAPVISAVGATQDGLEAPKKVKLDGSPEVSSKVIHIRSIPSDCTEAEIVQLGIPFGRMHNILLLKQKNQAFLEMEDESVASAMVQYYNECQATVRGRKVYLQFSNHRELKTDQNHSPATFAQNSLQSINLLGDGLSDQTAKPILRVIIDNLLYPVTIDTLHQIFSRYGSVLRIVTFTKNNTFQALVQFSDTQTAQTAKQTLDGMNIYNGCCTLRIDYSKLSSLSVRYNNDKSRDYTNPTLPSGEGSPGGDGQAMGMASPLNRAMTTLDPASLNGLQVSPFVSLPGVVPAGAMAPITPMAGTISPELAGVAPLQMNPAAQLSSPMPDLQQTQLGNLFAQAGAPAQAADPQLLGLTAIAGLPGQFGLTGVNLQGPLSGLPAGLQIPGVTIPTSSVVLVSNLNEQMVTPDSLFTLFGVYGDVIRVKILFNKKDNALIQYSEPQMAQLAISNLDKAVLWGKSIRVAPSKHTLVQMPREGQADAGLTKDYTNSPLHRFKKPGSKNFQNIFPPSLVLHLSNIPGTINEEDLTEMFAKYGSIVAFKFFPKDRKMALVQMSSVEESIAALIAMHDYQLAEGQNLRVSFSKSKI